MLTKALDFSSAFLVGILGEFAQRTDEMPLTDVGYVGTRRAVSAKHIG